MAPQTGRTSSRYTTVHIDNSGGALTQLTSVNQLNGLALDSDTIEQTAWADTIKAVMLGIPGFKCTMGGVFDTTDHTTLTGINNLNTPLSFDVRVGIRHTWEAGEPQFGITSTASNGMLIHGYSVDLTNMTWTAVIELAAGSAAPAWGTVAET